MNVSTTRAIRVSRRSTQLIALAVIRTAAITHADQIQTPYTGFTSPRTLIFYSVAQALESCSHILQGFALAPAFRA